MYLQILAIFAFATTTSHSSYSEFQVTCKEGDQPIVQALPFYYPFKLTESAQFQQPFCNSTADKETQSPCCDYNSPAEFYVFVGVMAFLYSLAAIILYVWFDDMYRRNENIPTADCVACAVFVLLFLVSTSAWAQGVSDLKTYINPTELFIRRVPECSKESSLQCDVNFDGNFASLNVSLIFGFLNMGVWAGNIWFLFKETKWHKSSEIPTPPPQMSPGGQYPPGGEYPGGNQSYPPPTGGSLSAQDQQHI